MKEKIISLLEKATDLKKEEIAKLIEIPPDISLGDYSFPCFSLAKTFKKNPREIAFSISQKISSSKEIEKIQVVGPYVNFFINKKMLAEAILKKIFNKKDKYGSSNIKKEKIIIEFVSPNTNKPLHLGHVRNIVLGQSLSNIFGFLGGDIKIISLNNDRGIHICKSMVAYSEFGKSNTPAMSNKKPDHFVGDYYVLFSQKLKENPNLENKAKECLQKWEAGDKKTLGLWKKMNSWALQGFKETYKKFNLKFDKEYYESKIYSLGKQIVLDALKKGLVEQKEDGAIFANLSNKGFGEKILLRADGTSIYITQDLYLAILKQKEFQFDKSIYITATEQNYHFKVLFALLSLFGYEWASKLYHLSYGMVNLESGKMKSREGNVIDADDIIEKMESLALREIESRYNGLSVKEKKKRASSIAMAAIRYYFLKTEKIRDMVFKPEESIDFDGNTGPYLLYAYARARSILKKSRYNSKKQCKINEISEKEKQLISKLSSFPEIVLSALYSLSPNLIANYAYELSQIFNEFYHAEKVIGSKREYFKLSLVNAFSQVLKNSLNLLNIAPLEQM